MDAFTRLYYCGGLALGIAFIMLAMRIAIGGSKPDVNRIMWQAIYDKARAEALVCHECGEELYPDLDHCTGCGAHIDLDR